MEENNTLEQPQVDERGQIAEANIDSGPINTTEGSIDPKFKDGAALSQAYDALQKEFTKKCQALSKLQKEYNDNKINNILPIYAQEGWQAKVDTFMESNPEAKHFSDKISKLIISDKEIASSNNPLENAWVKILKENYKSPTTMMEDESFVDEYVIKNKEIKTKIIKNYLENLEIENSPKLISKHNGTSSVLTPPIKPKSLEEANEIARSLLKN